MKYKVHIFFLWLKTWTVVSVKLKVIQGSHQVQVSGRSGSSLGQTGKWRWRHQCVLCHWSPDMAGPVADVDSI